MRIYQVIDLVLSQTQYAFTNSTTTDYFLIFKNGKIGTKQHACYCYKRLASFVRLLVWGF